MSAAPNLPAPAAARGPRRRQWLQSLCVAGSWWLGGTAGARVTGQRAEAPAPNGFSPWLRFAPDGRLTVFSNVADLGQGSAASLRALVGLQLGLAPAEIAVEPAPLQSPFFNPYTKNYATFGSLGARVGAALLVPAAAAARALLQQAAALHWGVDPASCSLAGGAVHHPAHGALRLAELLESASRLSPPPKPAPLRAPLPAPPPHRAAERVSGQLRYGLDQHLPGQLQAVSVGPAAFGARVARIANAAAVQRRPGVLRVLDLGSSVVVVARGSWAALQAAQALQVEWQGGAAPAGSRFTTALREAAQAGAGQRLHLPGQTPDAAAPTAQALAEAAQTLDLLFEFPFLAQLPMEPLNATARVGRDGVEVWLGTQAPLDTQRAIARLTGLPPERIQLHLLPAGGGFGRRLEHDWVLEAVRVAQALPGQAVQLLWPRARELSAGYYRPAMATRVRLALDSEQRPRGLRVDMASPSIAEHSGLTQSDGLPAGIDWSTSMGWWNLPYALPAPDLRWTRVDAGIPVGYWRSVAHSQNGFVLEHLLDLLARHSAQDPLALRRQLLAGNSRALAFVDALAQAAGWGQPLPAGCARGLALNAANGSLSGHVVELQRLDAGRLRLRRITAAIDCGRAFDADAVRAQVMGGTLFGLHAALRGEIRLDEQGQLPQQAFAEQALLRLAELPPIELLLVPSSAPPGGVGEEGVPSIAPALANALLAAGSDPITGLPLSRAGWTLEASDAHT